ASPAAVAPLDTIEIVTGMIAVPVVDRRGRWHAERRDRSVRTLQPFERMHVVVAVQHQLGAAPPQHLTQLGRIEQPLEAVARMAERWMMQQDHAAGAAEPAE